MPNAEPSPDPWSDALSAFDEDLRRRAVAAKTRTAYAIDCRQFSGWATHAGLEPASVDVRALRRYVATLSQRGMAASTIARKLAALRGLLAIQVSQGSRIGNPAELHGEVATPP